MSHSGEEKFFEYKNFFGQSTFMGHTFGGFPANRSNTDLLGIDNFLSIGKVSIGK